MLFRYLGHQALQCSDHVVSSLWHLVSGVLGTWTSSSSISVVLRLPSPGTTPTYAGQRSGVKGDYAADLDKSDMNKTKRCACGTKFGDGQLFLELRGPDCGLLWICGLQDSLLCLVSVDKRSLTVSPFGSQTAQSSRDKVLVLGLLHTLARALRCVCLRRAVSLGIVRGKSH